MVGIPSLASLRRSEKDAPDGLGYASDRWVRFGKYLIRRSGLREVVIAVASSSSMKSSQLSNTGCFSAVARLEVEVVVVFGVGVVIFLLNRRVRSRKEMLYPIAPAKLRWVTCSVPAMGRVLSMTEATDSLVASYSSAGKGARKRSSKPDLVIAPDRISSSGTYCCCREMVQAARWARRRDLWVGRSSRKKYLS
ncbi:hypothetical protein AA313_de0202874 [Arthrobotrys entomopaga]|nr:hypothetical protein AA313_de0202874 [Arthrobotrys entomopaga]